MRGFLAGFPHDRPSDPRRDRGGGYTAWTVADGLADDLVRSLCLADDGTLWVGTSLGAMEIELATRELKNTFTRDHGLANEYVFGIGIDADN